MAGPELSRRLGSALGQHTVSLAERQTIIDAAIRADAFKDLPAAVQALVKDIESRPGWVDAAKE